MILPLVWNLKRPGLLIPVFFLSLLPLWGQLSWKEASAASLGNTYMTRRGFSCASQNQAGLGWLERNTLSFQHARPFTMRELGISSISTQVCAGRGAFGATLTTFGITGLRQSDLWISYGMKIHPEVTMGVGIHCWNLSSGERVLQFPGISFAIGVQAILSERFKIGAHVLHPAGWAPGSHGPGGTRMVIAAGCCWEFLMDVVFYADLRLNPEHPLQSSSGLEMKLKERCEVQIGMQNRPFSISGGISLLLTRWTLQVAFELMKENGTTPYSSLTYGW